jgi:hypothetical protein
LSFELISVGLVYMEMEIPKNGLGAFEGADSNSNPNPETQTPSVENTAPVAEMSKAVEQGPSFREVGRARMEKIGGFFFRAKERIQSKFKQVGGGLASMATRAKEIGIAGVEFVLATPEMAMAGAETVVGAVEAGYNRAKDRVNQTKDNLVAKKNGLMEGGKEAIANAVEAVKDARDATSQFAQESLYNAADRIAKPFLEYQRKKLEKLVGVLEKRAERGTVPVEKVEGLKYLLAQYEAVLAV